MPSPTLAIFLVIVGTLCSIILIRRASQSHNKHVQKLPPGPWPLPVIGSLHMLTTLPHRGLQKLAKKYGPIMSLRLGNVLTVVVSSPEAAELFLKTNDSVFASRPKLQATEYMWYGTKGMAFKAYGSYWRSVRKLCTLHLLSSSKIVSFAELRKEDIRSMMEGLKRAAVAREVVDISKLVGEVIANISCRIILGKVRNDIDGLTGLVGEALALGGAVNIADYVPYLAQFDLQGYTRRMKRVSVNMNKMLEKIIIEHEQEAILLLNEQEEEHGMHKGFVDVLLSLMNQPMNPQDEKFHIIDRTDIKAILLDMISASFDTSATAIEWTLSELLRNPRVMETLQGELESVIGMDQMVEEKDIGMLEYLDLVVKESFRLHPVGPLLIPHESMQDITIKGYHIPKKSRIIVNTWAIGRDPKVWSEDVEEFYPERFVGSNNIDMKGRDFRLLPFGSGRRGCPGMQLGLVNVQLVLAQMLHCFNWELPYGTNAEDLDMLEKFGLSMGRANHLLSKPTYRLLF
ncbi:cytochrome P450 CYP736A12-like [Humulus lupulus]|uniref:cytochrome P450 CYP736A12-like n=1 Tax=Humulus lupulus TaxID=3486 RepID=UPI002B405735|nr:cytochrome P450 CYP736A12-like [Humulus lupulus]